MSFAAPADSVHVRAPGKINVYLGVGGRHEDGYHALATVFQAVSLYEDVIARHADDFSITVSGVDDLDSVPLDDRNLAMRAAKLLASAAGYEGGALGTVEAGARGSGSDRLGTRRSMACVGGRAPAGATGERRRWASTIIEVKTRCARASWAYC